MVTYHGDTSQTTVYLATDVLMIVPSWSDSPILGTGVDRFFFSPATEAHGRRSGLCEANIV